MPENSGWDSLKSALAEEILSNPSGKLAEYVLNYKDIEPEYLNRPKIRKPASEKTTFKQKGLRR